MSRYRFPALLGISLILAGMNVAYADGCPAGTITNPVGAGGQPQCVPGANHQNWGGTGSQGSTGAHWANRWGAIAFDPVNGKVGVANDMASKRKATKGAIDQCKSKGGKSCEIQIDYSNQCGAIVYGDLGERIKTATASGTHVKDAEGLALSSCEKIAGVQCKVFFSGCSYPEPLQ